MLLLVLGHMVTAIVACGITALVTATRMAKLELQNEVLQGWIDEHGGFTETGGNRREARGSRLP